jgi:hypothetical protein
MDTDSLAQMQRILRKCPDTVPLLGRMIAELEALPDVLVTVSDSWRQRFHAQWAALEETYAAALDRGQQTLTEEGNGIVVEAVAELRDLLDEAISIRGPG